MNFSDFIGSEKWVHLVSIENAGNRGLRAIVCYAELDLQMPRDIVGKHVSEIMRKPVEYRKVPHYELHWQRFLMYSVRDESFAGNDKAEKFEGHAIRRFARSWLLDAVPQFTNAPDFLPLPIIHFGIYCLDDIVDILAFEEPIITQLEDA